MATRDDDAFGIDRFTDPLRQSLRASGLSRRGDDSEFRGTESAHRVRRPPRAPQHFPQLLGDTHHGGIGGRIIESRAFGRGCQRHTGQRLTPSCGRGANLPGAASESASVVQSSRGIEQPVITETVGFTLGCGKCVQLVQQHVAIEREHHVVPRPALVGRDLLTALARIRGRDDHRRRGPEVVLAAQTGAELQAVPIREPGVEDHGVGPDPAGQVESLARVVGPKDGVAVRSEDRFKRPGRPLLIVRDEHKQRARRARRDG